MSSNKRVPKDLSKYVVVRIAPKKAQKQYRYFPSQKAAKTWAKTQSGTKRLFRIDYDYYGDVKG